MRRFEERFWNRVDRSGECWLWKGERARNGYGRVKTDAGAGRTGAHRAAWMLANGPIPDGLFVCHSCDTPACVRPNHLFLGSHVENMRDMVAKGRAATGDRNVSRREPARLAWGDRNGSRTQPERLPRGEARVKTKLTTATVLAIRAAAAQGVGPKALAQQFGTSRGNVHNIVRRETWTHLP